MEALDHQHWHEGFDAARAEAKKLSELRGALVRVVEQAEDIIASQARANNLHDPFTVAVAGLRRFL